MIGSGKRYLKQLFMAYKPPYTVTVPMIRLVGEINRLIGQIQGYQLLVGNLKLRKSNKVKSILSSLAIEGNTLSEGQVTDILNGKPVFGPPREILEVKNAVEVYDVIRDLDAHKEDDLLRAHGLLMKGLIGLAGVYRQSGVGVFDGEKAIHIAPPYNMVPRLMGNLFDYLVNFEEEPIIASCVFHYEFEFIHPFEDGNGRMGRLWQTLILMRSFPILQYVPFETIVHQRQAGYYQALADSQSVSGSNPFILFMLEALKTALEIEADRTNVSIGPADRLLIFKEQWPNDKSFTRADYQKVHKNISPAVASRDLRRGVDEGQLSRTGEMATTTYRFVKLPRL